MRSQSKRKHFTSVIIQVDFYYKSERLRHKHFSETLGTNVQSIVYLLRANKEQFTRSFTCISEMEDTWIFLFNLVQIVEKSDFDLFQNRQDEVRNTSVRPSFDLYFPFTLLLQRTYILEDDPYELFPSTYSYTLYTTVLFCVCSTNHLNSCRRFLYLYFVIVNLFHGLLLL